MDPLTIKLARLAAAAKASQDLAEDDREARDAAIEEADIAGWSAAKIAAAMAPYLSRPGVHRIVVDRTAARQKRLTRQIGL